MKIKAHAKVNIFLKIVGHDGFYHLIKSRFMKVENLYDEIEIVEGEKFNIIGDINCALRDNSVFRSYIELTRAYPDIKKWFIGKEIRIHKNIPEMAGLGGGSSDAAAFLRLVNEMSGLNLSKKELAEIGKKIGSDVPFFIYDYDSANVYGRGDIVEKYDEDLLNIEVFTPPLECSTPDVYREYKERFFNPKDTDFDKKDSLELLNNYSPTELNDLFQPALSLYPDLYKYMDKGFFTGSGSSFFRVK
ncbi:4-diphosphocytidyl-2C-methyl-D-erythritol kinase [Nautilia profundicola AmH]|uniref:4-diphosphocytidyl-2-C-methyl-D-erythritol kinase n=1 Tax=Nautilia profundicola (strain ATCC BAA-1463 / DSM 18972 / AmH) TaxID=598659 RepID=B9L8F3_NAUPA|nr:4-(cytidine 5'-diphospho)-2-C-methyl-D-erythritol kinase [Nautilia profundicola]ACM93231.1 4-diphosphocytidyl-2C-methyl-D-erythritol kinase [Nautilia profundicola AmH]